MRVRLADASFWVSECDSLGQVKSGKKYWSDGAPVAGQQFGYGREDTGNRTVSRAGGDENGSQLPQATYTRNRLNQCVSRGMPGGFDVVGLARADTASLAVKGQAPYRRRGILPAPDDGP